MTARETILRKVRESVDVKQQFFERNAEPIAQMCEAMALRLLRLPLGLDGPRQLSSDPRRPSRAVRGAAAARARAALVAFVR